jgi:hypothetical protein
MLNLMTNNTWERRLSSSAFTFLFYEKERQRQAPTNAHTYKFPKIKRGTPVHKDSWILSNKENIEP